jgi:hypothetical protein
VRKSRLVDVLLKRAFEALWRVGGLEDFYEVSRSLLFISA